MEINLNYLNLMKFLKNRQGLFQGYTLRKVKTLFKQ